MGAKGKLIFMIVTVNGINYLSYTIPCPYKQLSKLEKMLKVYDALTVKIEIKSMGGWFFSSSYPAITFLIPEKKVIDFEKDSLKNY